MAGGNVGPHASSSWLSRWAGDPAMPAASRRDRRGHDATIADVPKPRPDPRLGPDPRPRPSRGRGAARAGVDRRGRLAGRDRRPAWPHASAVSRTVSKKPMTSLAVRPRRAPRGRPRRRPAGPRPGRPSPTATGPGRDGRRCRWSGGTGGPGTSSAPGPASSSRLSCPRASNSGSTKRAVCAPQATTAARRAVSSVALNALEVPVDGVL